MSQAKFRVAGMTCDSCADSVQGALRNIGVEGHVDLVSQMVTVQYDDTQVSMNNIKDAIQGQGYQVM